ncbi:Jerky like protein-like [Cucumispora dikerogammari]|nr:Jerky like protein-like [Cucumispora dikerogammari]
MFFPKNTTGILQPMDRGIIRNFKLFSNRYKLSDVLNQVEKSDNVYDIYKKITLRDTIIYSELAWNDVSQATINNCFKHLCSPNWFLENELQSLITVEKQAENDEEFKTTCKSLKIADPLRKNEFNELNYTENDEILFCAEHSKNTNCLKESLKEKKETINSNNSCDNEKSDRAPLGNLTRVSEIEFETSIRILEQYISERDSLDEYMYELQKNLVRFRRKRNVKKIS